MQGTTKSRGTGVRRWCLAGAALACVLLAAPVAPAAAAPPADDKAGSAQRPTGPRRMGLGGTRAKGAKKMKGLGGAKFSFRSLNDRSLKPRYSLPGRGHDRTFPTIIIPLKKQVSDGAGGPPPTITYRSSSTTSQSVRGALLSGSGVRNTAFEGAVRQRGFDDVDVGPRFRLGPGASVHDGGTPAAAIRELVTSASPAPGAAGLLSELAAPTRGEMALEIARRELGAQGYQEVELGRDDTAFIRSRNPAVLEAIRQQREIIRRTSDQRERWYEWEVRRHFNRRFDPCSDDDFDPTRMQYVMEGAGVDPRIQYGPAGVPPEPAEPLSEFDAALLAIEAGRYSVAAEGLRAYLEGEPEDMEILRLLGIVELLAGRTDKGIESIGRAYETDPYLATRPVGSELVLNDPDQLRRAVGAAVGYGHRTEAPRAWLAAAVLMEAQGRREQAAKMLDRAIAKGLDRSVADEMLLALRP